MSQGGRWASSAQLRRTLSIPLALLAVAALVSACGVDAVTPGELAAQSLRASGALRSGRLSVRVALELEGVPGLAGRPLTFDAQGPFARAGDGHVQRQLTVAMGLGSKSARLVLERYGGRSYLGVDGTIYRLPAQTPQTADASGPGAAIPRSWLRDVRDGGPTMIAGAYVEHLTARLNRARLAAALSALAGSARLRSLLRELAHGIRASRVDLYVGTADRVVREAQLRASFSVPAAASAQLGGLRGGSLRVRVALSQLNGPQAITAPAHAEGGRRVLNGIFALESRFGALSTLLARAPTSLGALLPALGSTSG